VNAKRANGDEKKGWKRAWPGKRNRFLLGKEMQVVRIEDAEIEIYGSQAAC
jgi:hypothetical protein